ncbi:MAG TPA: GH1 family beta-glucosidase [Candidatus Dormibacteraeota bacterium]|nr:GH1 family beta-glucosidase [Candidatus Dormibacteraeota bacterium]
MTPARQARFVWGAATSAYQIEGAVRADGRGPSIWDRFCATPGNIANGDAGDVACDHYRRFDEDVGLMAQLGLDAYRFSVSWPRVIPDGVGRVNQRGLDFYRRLVDRLVTVGIRPYVTLYHWDLPDVLQDRWGGWIGRDTADAFVEYADVVSHALGDGVEAWITLNEPWVSSWLSYGWGSHAPGYRDLQLGMQAAHHLLLAHGLAVPVIRRNTPRAEVGITLNFSAIDSASDDPLDVQAARAADVNVNLWFLDPIFHGTYHEHSLVPESHAALRIRDGDMAIIKAPIDFLGVNYYTRFTIRFNLSGATPFGDYVEVPHAKRTTMGWEIHPDGLYDTLARVQERCAPAKIYVTENGAAFPDTVSENGEIRDPERIAYLQSHLDQVRRAIDAGIPVAGYFAWSLLDNFEWTEGYRQRFGLVYVDYATQRRIVKESGRWYARMIAASRAATPPGA